MQSERPIFLVLSIFSAWKVRLANNLFDWNPCTMCVPHHEFQSKASVICCAFELAYENLFKNRININIFVQWSFLIDLSSLFAC